MSVEVYGASDDLIEVTGDVSEEFGAYSRDDKAFILAFSDGTVLSMRYGDDAGNGIWTIRKVASGSCEVEIRTAVDTGDDNTDRATIRGKVSWVVFGNRFMAAKAAKGKA